MNLKAKRTSFSMLIVGAMLFILIGCKTNNTKNPETFLETILVDLKQTHTPEALILDFSEFNLQNKKQVSRPLNIFLFTFNQDKIDADALVTLLRKSDKVENAQTNKKIDERN